jgi:hypothetical protein
MKSNYIGRGYFRGKKANKVENYDPNTLLHLLVVQSMKDPIMIQRQDGST